MKTIIASTTDETKMHWCEKKMHSITNYFLWVNAEQPVLTSSWSHWPPRPDVQTAKCCNAPLQAYLDHVLTLAETLHEGLSRKKESYVITPNYERNISWPNKKCMVTFHLARSFRGSLAPSDIIRHNIPPYRATSQTQLFLLWKLID